MWYNESLIEIEVTPLFLEKGIRNEQGKFRVQINAQAAWDTPK
jgi:hypothetical protein